MLGNFGINKEGFRKKTYIDLVEEFKEKLKSQDAFGENIDFSEQDPLYQFSVPYLMLLSELWEVAEHCFYSVSPKFAEGNILSATGKTIGIARKQGNKATGTITITGDKDTIIQKGFMVGTKDGVNFITTKDVVIGENGEVVASIQATEKGDSGNVVEGVITEIINPTLGVKSITNKQATKNGENPETDLQFRERYNKSVSLRATNIYDSIRANVLKVAGVKDALVRENRTMQEVEGLPPKSFHVVALGGENNTITKAIFEKAPVGIESFGNVKVQVEDSKKIKHLISFSRPVDKNVWIKLKITKNETFVEGSDKIIKEAIKSYIDTFRIGQSVILYKIITTVDKAKIDGIEDMDITVSTDGKSYNSNNIVVKDLEVAKTDIRKIEVIYN